MSVVKQPAKSVLKSMRVGEIAEKLLIDTLNEFGYNAKKNGDHSKRYEFDVEATINGELVTFEVKFDVMAARTGNIAIEYWNSKKNEPSGLTATKAKYWVHVIEDEEQNKLMYITEVVNLIGFIELNKPKRVIEGGGDNNANLYLYQKEEILKCFTEVGQGYFA